MKSRKYEGCLICTDMDGTLLTTDKQLSRENALAIRHFQENGGLFTVATGRYKDFVNDYAQLFVPNTHVISLNGCVISRFDTQQELRSTVMDKACFDEAEHIFSSCPDLTLLLVNTQKGFEVIKPDRLERLNELEINEKNSVIKMTYMCLPGQELSRQTREFFEEFSRGRYNCERSWPGGMEYYSLDGGKENAVMWLKRHTGADKLVCVGDYENDIGMLKVADWSVAVSNALDCVKLHADFITVSNDESAIARVIEEL